MENDVLHHDIGRWFSEQARDLPWRRAGCTPWGVLVSEFMLQQTPVARVLPQWQEWMQRWPSPADLALESSGEAVRAWGRLGYPRRALRLHASATAIVKHHQGKVPSGYASLLALPGIGSYTAAAVAAFAFGSRETVVDTNIRRVHARLVRGNALPEPALTTAEIKLAERLLPVDEAASVLWNAGVMELGAMVCTARAPKCESCPVVQVCAWVGAGRPEPHYSPRGQSWAGTDRQVRGAMLAVLRAADGPVNRELLVHDAGRPVLAEANRISGPLSRLSDLSAPLEQLERALRGLLEDGLAELTGTGIQLPGCAQQPRNRSDSPATEIPAQIIVDASGL